MIYQLSRVSLPVLWTTNCEDIKMTMTTVIVNMIWQESSWSANCQEDLLLELWTTKLWISHVDNDDYFSASTAWKLWFTTQLLGKIAKSDEDAALVCVWIDGWLTDAGRGRLTQVLSDLGVEPLIYYSGLPSRPTVIEAITVINSKSVITVNTAAGWTVERCGWRRSNICTLESSDRSSAHSWASQIDL